MSFRARWIFGFFRTRAAYGLGWSTGGGNWGHGGAYATNMTIDPKRGIIAIWMVQHARYPDDGNQAQGAFMQWAREHFGD